MHSDNINHGYIIDYIRQVLPKTQGILKEMEEYAANHHVPIIQPEVGKLIFTIAMMVKPQKILEIGTAIGYSAILLSSAMNEGGSITTIERYEKMVPIAEDNIKRAGKEKSIRIIQGDAGDILPTLEGEYEYIFLDAAKGQYPEFFPHCLRLLKPGGVLVCDNILYKGMTASDELVVRRKKTIVKRLRSFIATICNHPMLETTIIPIGDGVAVSYKKQ